MLRTIKSLYFEPRCFQVMISIVLFFIVAFILPSLLFMVKAALIMTIAAIVIDFMLLFLVKKGMHATRFTPDKLSNGDNNDIRIFIENHYGFQTALKVIDEVPHQFQLRNTHFDIKLAPHESHATNYRLRPTKRGSYSFGVINLFAKSPIGFLSRRFQSGAAVDIPVYPSYLQMRQYELMAISNKLTEYGIKKIRRIGNNMEFEQIKDYVQGDDIRTINWKATARKHQLMVNNYQDERSQQVYALIDKGRVMKMPFEGLSLLDHAINTSLVITNIAIKKDDKAGMITFQHKIGNMVPASKRSGQMKTILEALYNEKTAYKETDFSRLHMFVRRKITQRSLLLCFTNFESIYAMQRQLPYLKSMASHHLLVVVIFKNTELDELISNPTQDLKKVYNKAIAEQMTYDKLLISKELQQHGIQTILTAPKDLTVNTINKYLELKSRGLI